MGAVDVVDKNGLLYTIVTVSISHIGKLHTGQKLCVLNSCHTTASTRENRWFSSPYVSQYGKVFVAV